MCYLSHTSDSELPGTQDENEDVVKIKFFSSEKKNHFSSWEEVNLFRELDAKNIYLGLFISGPEG